VCLRPPGDPSRKQKRRNPFGLRLFILPGAEEASSQIEKRIMISKGKIDGGARIWSENAAPPAPKFRAFQGAGEMNGNQYKKAEWTMAQEMAVIGA
jgi:hypothetical protein